MAIHAWEEMHIKKIYALKFAVMGSILGFFLVMMVIIKMEMDAVHHVKLRKAGHAMEEINIIEINVKKLVVKDIILDRNMHVMMEIHVQVMVVPLNA
jgi:hypothetical protein